MLHLRRDLGRCEAAVYLAPVIMSKHRTLQFDAQYCNVYLVDISWAHQDILGENSNHEHIIKDNLQGY